jgi:hypothetical protein
LDARTRPLVPPESRGQPVFNNVAESGSFNLDFTIVKRRLDWPDAH